MQMLCDLHSIQKEKMANFLKFVQDTYGCLFGAIEQSVEILVSSLFIAKNLVNRTHCEVFEREIFRTAELFQ